MASTINDNSTTVIDLGEAKVVVPKEYPILNPEMISSVKCVWIGALRRSDNGLPQRVIWLDDKSFEDGYSPDKGVVLSAYFEKVGATDDQKARFARWDALCDAWGKNQTPELADEIQNGDYNVLGLWPIIPGSVAAEYYFVNLDGDEVV